MIESFWGEFVAATCIEGEDDRTPAGWKQAHEWNFGKQGVEIDDDTLMVLERFELLWPEPQND